MDPSPQGRDIEHVEGSPSGIISRGEAITRLGEQMRRSATILEGIKNNSLDSGGQVGKAIEELADKIDDSYKTLRQAAELYEPVGPVITAYGEELESVQPLIASAVGDSEGLWATYESLPGNVAPRGTGGFNQPEANSPEAEAQAGEDRAKKAAYDAWEERAQDFDAHYDTWEAAFDTAVSGITDGMSDGIEDGFWDDIGPAVDFLKNVVDIAALIVAVVAIVVGGPLWLALAAVLAIAALALTFAQFKRGKASGWDLAFAALGVVPLGKITTVTKLVAVNKLAKSGGEAWSASKNVLKTGPLSKFTDLGVFKAPQKLANASDPTMMNSFGFKGYENVMQGYETALGRQLTRAESRTVQRLATTERNLTNAGAALGHYGKLVTFANNDWNPLVPDVYKPPREIGVFV